MFLSTSQLNADLHKKYFLWRYVQSFGALNHVGLTNLENSYLKQVGLSPLLSWDILCSPGATHAMTMSWIYSDVLQPGSAVEQKKQLDKIDAFLKTAFAQLKDKLISHINSWSITSELMNDLKNRGNFM